MNDLIEVKTAELTRLALDWAVARALGFVDYPEDSVEQGAWWYTDPLKAPFGERIYKADWKPSTDWRQGGPLVEGYAVSLETRPGDGWLAQVRGCQTATADLTPLMAVCRAVVVAKLGDIVNVPAYLVRP